MEGPLWVALFDLAYEVQSEKDKKVIDALFQDMRPAVAARIANTNRQHVYRVIDRFRRDLVAAHVAWKMRDRV
jgi:capsular polysaccharide biosynthesis protein